MQVSPSHDSFENSFYSRVIRCNWRSILAGNLKLCDKTYIPMGYEKVLGYIIGAALKEREQGERGKMSKGAGSIDPP